jgi:hypothetical protein
VIKECEAALLKISIENQFFQNKGRYFVRYVNMEVYGNRFFTIVLIIFFANHPFQGRCQSESYGNIDRHASKIKWEDQGITALTDQLILPAKDDFERIRAIYTWVIHHIEYDNEAYQGGLKRINHSNYDVLSRGKAVCFGYANLVKKMADIAEIPCEVISGYSKESATASRDLKETDHAWNAVFINDQWHLLDATWASTLKDNSQNIKVGNLDYFLTGPQKFVKDHLPSDPAWQLLTYPINVDQFRDPHYPKEPMQNALPYQYNDSIAFLRAHSGLDRVVKEYQRSFQFHPTKKNGILLGASYIDKGIQAKEHADALYENNKWEESIPYYQIAISCFEKAVLLTDFRDWQLEGYAFSLLNLGQAQYNQEWDQSKDFEGVITHLKKAKELLLSHPGPHSGTDQAIQFIDDFIRRLE